MTRMVGYLATVKDGDISITLKGLISMLSILLVVVSMGAGVSATITNLKIENKVATHENKTVHSGAAKKEELVELRSLVLVQASQQERLAAKVEKLVDAQWLLLNQLNEIAIDITSRESSLENVR